MASKLDYLKKYLAKPGQDASDAAAGGHKAQAVKAVKDKLRKKKHRSEPAAMTIRDMSDVLPQSRGKDLDDFSHKRRGDLGVGGSLADEPEEEDVFVDPEEVAQKSKIDTETSGVAWSMKMTQKRSRPTGVRGAPVKTEEPRTAVVKQEPADAASDDLSPPRKGPAASAPAAAAGARPRAAGSDDDLSPPRGRAPGLAAAARPAAAAGSDDDLSPPRGRPRGRASAAGQASDSDLSPPRKEGASKKSREGADSDLSPPRQPAKTEPKVKAEPRSDDDDDLSPPRKSGGSATAAGGKPDMNRPSGRHDSDSDDLSPPRRGGKPEGSGAARSTEGRASAAVKREPAADGDNDDDLSPPRAAPAVKTAGRTRHDSDSEDLSPPRKDGAVKKEGAEEEPEKMSSGLRAGLVRGSDLQEEAKQVREARRAAVLAAPDEETGKGAATVYRSKTGATIEREQWVEEQKKKKRKKLSDYPEQELEWGGGVKQRFNEEEEKAEVERIAAQPFARFEPDQRYMEELKGRQDWNDPMRNFKEEEDPKVAKPKCPHAPWPNRFNIPPGYRWDGSVRGNGFEKRWLEAKNGRQHKQAERWKWEMEEM